MADSVAPIPTADEARWIRAMQRLLAKKPATIALFGCESGLVAGEACRGWSPDGCQHGAACPDCHGSGYTRHDLLWVTAAELRGEISRTVAAGILWCSVLRVEAGLGPCVLDKGSSWTGGTAAEGAYRRYGRVDAAVGLGGWALYLGDSSEPIATGPEAGEEGKAAADAAALSAGYVLREPGSLLLPLPGGVVGRLEAP